MVGSFKCTFSNHWKKLEHPTQLVPGFGKKKLFRGVAFGFAGLDSFEGAGAAALGIEFSLPARKTAKERCNFGAECGSAFDVFQNVFIRHVVIFVAMRAGCFHKNPFYHPLPLETTLR